MMPKLYIKVRRCLTLFRRRPVEARWRGRRRHLDMEPDYYRRTRLLYKNPTTIREPDYYSRTRLLFKNPITIQEPDCYTRIQILYNNTITIQ